MAIITFPEDFRFGVSTAAYQIEGAYNEDGRGMSIWDTFSRIPGKVKHGDNGDVACDSYHRMDEDIQLLKDLGVNTYRFSIAWPRILPNGMGEINEKGIEHYHQLIDKLVENGIEPMVTIYHWDLPQTLQDKGGWKNRHITDAFADYAEILFKEYGDKVNYWLTINEPWCISYLGHYFGEQAPGETNLQAAIDVSHHLLLAHGKAVQRFRRVDTKGQIGFAPNVTWFEPYSTKKEDIDACHRTSSWFMEWFFDPVFKSSYPKVLIDWFGAIGVEVNVMPGDMEIISEPIDMLGINYYKGTVARYKESQGLFERENIDIGYEYTDIGASVDPEGFYKVLTAIHKKYGDIPIFITENGACYNDGPENGVVKDERRIRYVKQHITEVNRALQSGVNIKGYYAWSLMDNFEWAYGYGMRFGLVHVDFETLKRTKKDSYHWYEKIAKNHWFEI